VLSLRNCLNAGSFPSEGFAEYFSIIREMMRQCKAQTLLSPDENNDWTMHRKYTKEGAKKMAPKKGANIFWC
jgi:hypothetical protein